MQDQSQHNAAFGYGVWIPLDTPGGQRVEVRSRERSGRHLMHAESPDQSELYFEVLAYEGRMDHGPLAEAQIRFLSSSADDGTVSEPREEKLQHLRGTTFEFRGTLQERWKVRRFLFVDGSDRTYRVVHDPRSALNTRVLASLELKGWGNG